MEAGEGLKLREIERDSRWITLALVGGCGLWASPVEVLGVATGGVVMWLNLHLWRMLVGQALRARPHLSVLVFKMAAKSVVLLGVTALLVVGLRIHLLAFLVGSTNLLLAIVWTGIKRYALRQGSG
ncbi:MAG: hypothetical protein HYY20_02660 [Candidatus Tectomicrobia bacterium]|uniref:ATP synthase subunit I n=1 Tax=Tectimicrobiota bacterium TaxID=2528274 RepID=A0A932CMB1_UNCTE|nr:hypothetical protein [Candidatus Tectomicrobia bacterium]